MTRTSTREPPADQRRTFRAALLIGIGLMAAVDEIIFHQVLGWHHFYDRSTSEIGLLSDGLLHATELILLVAGFFLLADARRAGTFSARHAWSGGLIGAGGFQLFDGIINHKLLRLHQIRYEVNLVAYDVAWNAFAMLLLLIGLVLWHRSRTQATPAA